MKRLAILILALSLPSTAFALTGAELMSSKSGYNIGYVLGVVETRLVVRLNDDPSQDRIRKCVDEAQIDPNTIYDLTVEYLKRNPSFVAKTAIAAIFNTVAEMCPPSN